MKELKSPLSNVAKLLIEENTGAISDLFQAMKFLTQLFDIDLPKENFLCKKKWRLYYRMIRFDKDNEN